MPESAGRMKIGQREIEMVAVALIEMFGDDAPNKAKLRASEYQDKGETEDFEFWTRLSKVIQELLDRQNGIDS